MRNALTPRTKILAGRLYNILGHSGWPPLILCVFLTFGCAGPQGAIKLSTIDAISNSQLVSIDERPAIETQGRLPSCVNHGKGWQGIDDGAFSASRTELLRLRLDSEFPGKFRKVIVKHFQNCFAIRSVTPAGALAPVSYAAAAMLDAAMKKGEDVTMTYIDFIIDGAEITAVDIRPFKLGVVWANLYERTETAAIISTSTEVAISEAVRNVRTRLLAE